MEPTGDEGPLFRDAYRRADAVDRAQGPAERRKAWVRLIPSALVALAEGLLRETMIVGAVLFSVIVALIGATSGHPGWMAGYLLAGVTGTVLVFLAIARHWKFARQWAAILGVFLLQCALMVAFGLTH